eukprot:gnl/TRDRNA2_/TRDRNA2_81401_c0_seq2.p2 gnl/TRDRNA2_/TRDRNA2_81401_c0~~gnl/TRDRNA2_/TRDRNA2_81401_c0_seq2.p2  ORF type:complete len:117 (+),score=2.15 gnl/TRDRNA2_/TRDRNA2_81401_c0_seq2:288-638(+)
MTKALVLICSLFSARDHSLGCICRLVLDPEAIQLVWLQKFRRFVSGINLAVYRSRRSFIALKRPQRRTLLMVVFLDLLQFSHHTSTNTFKSFLTDSKATCFSFPGFSTSFGRIVFA